MSGDGKRFAIPPVCGACRWHLTMRSRSGEITWCDLARRLVRLDGTCPAWRSAVDMPHQTHEKPHRIDANEKAVYTDVFGKSCDCAANACGEDEG